MANIAVSRRGLVAAALMALLIGGPESAASSGRGNSATRVAGRTTVVGTGFTVIDVRIPKEVTLAHQPFDRNPDIEIEGGGRLAGVVLIKDDERFRGPALFAGLFNPCHEAGCEASPTRAPEQQFLSSNFRHRGDRIVIPPGDYKLYLIADETTVKVTLNFAGMKGATEIRPVEAAEIRLDSPPALPTTGGEGATYTWGRSRRLAGKGLGLTLVWSASSASAYAERGTCLYRGAPPTADPLAYGPSCRDAGAAGVEREEFGPGPSPTAVSWIEFELAKGKWSQGAYLTSAGKVEDAGILLLWLVY